LTMRPQALRVRSARVVRMAAIAVERGRLNATSRVGRSRQVAIVPRPGMRERGAIRASEAAVVVMVAMAVWGEVAWVRLAGWMVQVA